MINNNEREKLEAEKRKVEEELKKHEGHKGFGTDVDCFDEEADEAEEFSANLGIQQALKERLVEIEERLRKLDKNKK